MNSKMLLFGLINVSLTILSFVYQYQKNQKLKIAFQQVEKKLDEKIYNLMIEHNQLVNKIEMLPEIKWKFIENEQPPIEAIKSFEVIDKPLQDPPSLVEKRNERWFNTK